MNTCLCEPQRFCFCHSVLSIYLRITIFCHGYYIVFNSIFACVAYYICCGTVLSTWMLSIWMFFLLGGLDMSRTTFSLSVYYIIFNSNFACVALVSTYRDGCYMVFNSIFTCVTVVSTCRSEPLFPTMDVIL